MTESTNPIGTNEPILTLVTSATLMPWVMVSLPAATSIPTTPRSTHTAIGDPMPSYRLGFTMPLVYRDFLYGMPTAMVAGLHSNASMYEDNNATITSPLNSYVASGSTIGNPSQITQHEGTGFSLPDTYTITTNSMLSIRQQMDESNHEMVNMLIQQIGMVSSPLI